MLRVYILMCIVLNGFDFLWDMHDHHYELLTISVPLLLISIVSYKVIFLHRKTGIGGRSKP